MPRKKRPSRWWWVGTLNGERWTSLPSSPIFASEEEAWEWAGTAENEARADLPPGVRMVPQEVDIAEVVR